MTDIKKQLPQTAVSWGKVRIANGGDKIRSASASRSDNTGRDMPCVRVSLYNYAYILQYEILTYDASTAEVCYGRLERILQLTLSDSQFWRHYAGKTVLLALIKPCKTFGKDATITATYYTEEAAPIITDVRAISSVVGRVKSRGKWAIIDRSTAYARTEFVQELDVRMVKVDDS